MNQMRAAMKKKPRSLRAWKQATFVISLHLLTHVNSNRHVSMEDCCTIFHPYASTFISFDEKASIYIVHTLAIKDKNCWNERGENWSQRISAETRAGLCVISYAQI